VVGALTLGKAAPWLMRALEGTRPEPVVLGASIAAVAAAVLVASGYRDGPFRSRRHSPGAWSVACCATGRRGWRSGGISATCGNCMQCGPGSPAFLAASALAMATPPAPLTIDLVAFGSIAAGAAGCVLGGAVADRFGRAEWVNLSMAVSGGCCLLVGFLFGGPFWLLTAVALVWGFFVVADSAQFSAMVTEVAPPHAVGTALTLQTSLGFLLTMVTIQAVPALVETVGWRWAFPLLALGPAAGIGAIRRMQRMRIGTSPG
jgi:predicted MFS family arabinose efflux permease